MVGTPAQPYVRDHAAERPRQLTAAAAGTPMTDPSGAQIGAVVALGIPSPDPPPIIALWPATATVPTAQRRRIHRGPIAGDRDRTMITAYAGWVNVL
jgi:hypothetical protein